MFDQPFYVAEDTPQSQALLERICSSARCENRAAAQRLEGISELWAVRLRECGDREDWAVDAVAAVTAEVAAALGISQGLAGSYLHYARAMRERLPEVAKVFLAGDLDYRLFQTIVYRTDLITDRDVLAAVDGQLAAKAPRWPSMTPGRLAAQIDKIVFAADRDAVRRRNERQAGRDVWIGDCVGGVSEIHGGLFTLTPMRWISGWMRWRPRYVNMIRVPRTSAVPTHWARWRPGRIGWDAAAGVRIAAPAARRRARW